MSKPIEYRYRTAVLAGPWRPSSEQAIEDAVKAKQAAYDGEAEAGYRWLVPGWIEQKDDSESE